MGFSLALATALAGATVFLTSGKTESTTATITADPEEVAVKADERRPLARLDLPDSEPTPQPEVQKRSEQAPSPTPKSQNNSASKPSAERNPVSESVQPVSVADWPAPKEEETRVANRSRSYAWNPEAVMTLTSDRMSLRNAPVMDGDSNRDLDKGIVHEPETSLPWNRDKQKNVYLAGHRLGWPGTGSRLIFYNLDKLRNGDVVVLRDRRDRTYRYRVIDKFEVGANERWIMGEIRGRDLLTLQTCTPIPTFHKRLIVRAEQI